MQLGIGVKIMTKSLPPQVDYGLSEGTSSPPLLGSCLKKEIHKILFKKQKNMMSQIDEEIRAPTTHLYEPVSSWSSGSSGPDPGQA